jgi:formate dehydrogenase assembly factor FdhD
MHDPVREKIRQVWRSGGCREGPRAVPEEAALALTYNGGTYAVMMGTPQDLRDFAIGFSLSEGVITAVDEIESFEAVELEDGIELRMWLAAEKAEGVSARRRQIAGPTGCGCRFHRRSSQARGHRWTRTVVHAAADYGCDGGVSAASENQRGNPRGACRCVLDAGARY